METIHLKESVMVSKGQQGTLILFGEDNSFPIQIGASFEALLPLMKVGASKSALVEHLRHSYPNETGLDAAIETLVEKLGQAGFLNVGQTSGNARSPKHERYPKAYYWTGMDGWLSGVLAPFKGMPQLLLMVGIAAPICFSIAAIGSFLSLWIAGMSGPIPLSMVNYFHLALGVVLVQVLLVPLHEMAHGVASKALGVKVTRFGIANKWLIFPIFFVETRSLLAIRNKWARSIVPAAGIMMDAVTCGLLVILAQLDVAPVVRSVAICALLIQIFTVWNNLNPLTKTDGANFLMTILDDYALHAGAILGNRSIYTSARSITIYRGFAALYCLGYLVAIVALIRKGFTFG